MLQQTRVAAAIPYYRRFLERFPDVRALAGAAEAEVLAAWSGLGYYSRARNLHKAAREIACTSFPRDYESIRELAGVGDYTAAAIASIAFGLPHAAVDGNVRRVIARLWNDSDADAHESAGALLDRRDPGRFNQALMELGATICLPRNPGCGGCPLARQCQARRFGTQSGLPAPRVQPAPERLTRTLLLIRRRGRILLAPSPRVQGFWDLPEEESRVWAGTKLGEFRHTITHRHYRFVVLRGSGISIPSNGRWFTETQMREIPLSTTVRKALRLSGR